MELLQWNETPASKRIKTGEGIAAEQPTPTVLPTDGTANMQTLSTTPTRDAQQDGIATLDSVLEERLRLLNLIEAQVAELNDRDAQYSKIIIERITNVCFGMTQALQECFRLRCQARMDELAKVQAQNQEMMVIRQKYADLHSRTQQLFGLVTFPFGNPSSTPAASAATFNLATLKTQSITPSKEL